MGVLKIDCYLSESQMEAIINKVSNHLDEADRSEIADFDYIDSNVRAYVEFDCFLDKVKTSKALLMNSDWKVLPEDTAVLRSRLKKIVSDYNKECNEAYEQAIAIRDDYEY